VKEREFQGYAYDGAEASFELMARRALHAVPVYFRLQAFRILDERRFTPRGDLDTLSEATIKVLSMTSWSWLSARATDR